MKMYIVIARLGIEIHTGRVQISKEQAARRAGKVVPVTGQDGVYEIVKPTMFKNGEKFGYDGTVSKAMLSEIEDEAESERQKAETVKKAEEAKPAAKGKK